MRALTLWQPMAWAISDGTKRIENRPWEPWGVVVGKRIAIHAGMRYHREHAEQIELRFGVKVPAKGELPQGAIVATAIVCGFVSDNDEDRATVHHLSPWYSGPVGWLLADVRKVDPPIPCKGALGLWRIPDEIERELLSREAA